MQITFTKKRFWSSRWGIASLGLGIVLIILLVWQVFFAEDDDAIIYTTESVVRGDIENLVTATGTLQPRDYVDVGAQVSGQLKKLHVEVGSEVKAGDLLAEIDATVYAAKVDATRAQLRNQQAQLVDREAQLKLADIYYQRQKNLFAEDATTTESLETAEANLKSAQAQLKVVQAQIQQIESTLRVEAANLEYARIYSPIDGTVVSITSRQGQTLNTNQMAPTIMRVADLSTMTVQTQVSEADIGKLRNDMPVYFTTLGSQGRRWYSKLDRIQPTPEVLNNVILYSALFDVPNENRILMTQMSTQVFFVESQAKDVLLVPMSALTLTPPARAKSDTKAKSENASKQQGVAKGDTSQQTESNTKPGNHNKPENSSKLASDKTEGMTDSKEGRAHPIRLATVKVMTEDGDIEERHVKVGVTNRVQAQIIEGLQEGELVVSGSSRPNQVAKVAPSGWGGGMGRR